MVCQILVMKLVTYWEQELTLLLFCRSLCVGQRMLKKSYWVTFTNPFLFLLQKCLKILCLSARHRKSSSMPPGQVLPTEPYPDFSFSVVVINRTQNIALNFVTHMQNSYETPQGNGCRPFQDPNCKFISVLERICCSIKTGSQQFDLYRKCSAQFRSLCLVLICQECLLTSEMLTSINLTLISEEELKNGGWSNCLFGQKKKSPRYKAGRWLSQATREMIIFGF